MPVAQKHEHESAAPYVVCGLYKFTPLSDLESMRRTLLAKMKKYQLRGTLLIATEGINGTFAGTRTGVDAVLAHLRKNPALRDLSTTQTETTQLPFKRAKVKIKPEIVTMGVAEIDPNQRGEYIAPEDWNALLDDDEVVVVDVRNSYETHIGGFDNARHPDTTNFREFPSYAAANLDPKKHKKVAMYCTGGIRCEKSTAYLKQQGFERVFQLKGGILAYLAKVPKRQSRWRGQCFVFDERVAVGHGLKQGDYDQCHACRWPLSKADRASSKYTPGASCPRCYGRHDAETQARFLQREKQVALAAQRGESHFGPEAMPPRAEKFKQSSKL